jgi:hypothetical protein
MAKITSKIPFRLFIDASPTGTGAGFQPKQSPTHAAKDHSDHVRKKIPRSHHE